MNATLTREGKIGHARPYEFVSANTVSRHVMDNEVGVCLNVGVRCKGMEPEVMGWADAVRWLDTKGDAYVFEGWYQDSDEKLHLQAISKA